jgi:hypothetical protein
MADGWCPLPAANEEMMLEARERLTGFLKKEGKDPAAFPVEMRTTRGGPDDWAAQCRAQEKLGTDYFTVVPSGVEQGVGPHLEALRRFKEAVS